MMAKFLGLALFNIALVQVLFSSGRVAEAGRWTFGNAYGQEGSSLSADDRKILYGDGNALDSLHSSTSDFFNEHSLDTFFDHNNGFVSPTTTAPKRTDTILPARPKQKSKGFSHSFGFNFGTGSEFKAETSFSLTDGIKEPEITGKTWKSVNVAADGKTLVNETVVREFHLKVPSLFAVLDQIPQIAMRAFDVPINITSTFLANGHSFIGNVTALAENEDALLSAIGLHLPGMIKSSAALPDVIDFFVHIIFSLKNLVCVKL